MPSDLLTEIQRKRFSKPTFGLAIMTERKSDHAPALASRRQFRR
jgi:hypothetical protein